MNITETGTVVGVEHGALVVEVVRTSACESCQAKQACGQAALAHWQGERRQNTKNHFRITFSGQALVGDHVELSMPVNAVSKAALLVYLFPLSLFFIGLLVSQLMGASELGQLILSLFFLAAAFLGLRKFSLFNGHEFTPEVLRLYSHRQHTEIITSSSSNSV